MIKLSKEAPWDKVKIGNITITKTKWVEADFDYRPIKKYIIEQELVDEPEIVTRVAEEKSVANSVDYSKFTKQELVKLCIEKGFETKGKNKSALIDTLSL